MESLSRHTLQQIVSSTSQGIMLIEARDPQLRIAYVNPAYEDMSGYSAAELVATSWKTIFADDENAECFAMLKRAIDRHEACEVTVPFFRKDGSNWLGEVSIRPLGDSSGETRYLLCQHNRTSVFEPGTVAVERNLLRRALGQARKKLVPLDRTDPVTGLLSLGHFMTLLKRDMNIARRQEACMTILLFEVVELDVYRQTFGSNAADSCLRMIGAQVAGTFRRAGDLCARYDEGMIVAAIPGQEVNQVTLLAKRVAEKIRGLGLHNPRAKSGRYVTVRSSVAAAKLGIDDVECLLERARTSLDSERKSPQKSAVS